VQDFCRIWVTVIHYQHHSLQRTICGQTCGSKLHFVSNHNKVRFCSKMFHFAHQFSKISRLTLLAPIYPCTAFGARSSSAKFDPHFQIPSAVSDLQLLQKNYLTTAVHGPSVHKQLASRPTGCKMALKSM